MDSERWQQIESLFNSVLQLEPSEREAFLDKACAGDESLREELISLLSSSETQDSFLEEPALSLGLEVMTRRREDMIGQSIDRYILVRLLGRGGMGEAYLAHDPRLDRRITLKLLLPNITGDEERVRRFKQEARAASAISHPNVAHIYEISEAEDQHFITMEYVAGKTLRQMLKQNSLSVAKSLHIAIQVTTALAAAHQAGVIHRDIKPENIMLRDDGYVKVLDFGLAKLTESREADQNADSQSLSSIHTELGLLMGTSHYMSPEQVRGQRVDERTDLWSMGVVLYEMLSGRRPFPGRAMNEIISAILEHEPEPLNHLPTDLQELVKKALRKNPRERYQKAETLLKELRRLHRQLESEWQDTLPTATDIEHESPIKEPVENLETFTTPVAHPTGDVGHLTTQVSPFKKEQPAPPRKKYSFLPLANWQWALAAMLLISMASTIFYFGWMRTNSSSSKLVARNIDLQFQRLNLSGNIIDIVISPDGKYVASIIEEQGKHSIHVMELATQSDLRIVAPSETSYSGLSFSPDGNYIYYIENQAQTGTLNRISKLGSGQRKIISNVNTPATFSPDGKQMAFFRFNIPEDTPDLVLAQADGAGQRTLTKRTSADKDVFPVELNGVGPAWSPDGKALACPTINYASSPREMNLEVLDPLTGTGRRLNSKAWYEILRISWMADGSGLVVAATANASAPFQLTLVSYPSGEMKQLTKDPNSYIRISATADSSHFLSLNMEENTSIWLSSAEQGKEFSPLNVNQKKGLAGITWSPEGKLIYTVNDGKDINLWTQDAEGSGDKQLTFESSKNRSPVVSADGRHVVFVSNRAGKLNLWRMERDGTGHTQLTRGTYEDMPSLTPDNKWVVYRTGLGLWKAPLAGGAPVQLFEKSALSPVLSPDGLSIACFTNDAADSEKWYLDIFDFQTLKATRRLDLPRTVAPVSGLRWTPDGKGLTYVSNSDGAANLWLQPASGGTAEQLTAFKDAQILSFAWSPDGKRLASVRSTKTYIPVLVKLFSTDNQETKAQ